MKGTSNPRIRLMIFILAGIILISGCIQPKTSSTNFTEHTISQPWKPDGVIGNGEYSRSQVMSEVGGMGRTFEIYWKNDAEYLYMAMRANTTGWIAVGFEPSDWMKDAEIVMGNVSDGSVTVQDQYSTGNYGPHIPITQLGGTNSILESGGKQENGSTIIEFKRRMNAGDKYNKIFTSGQVVPIIWGFSDSESSDVKHIADGKGDLHLQ